MPHRIANRHVQGVDLALPLGMLKLPHPLLADAVDHRSVVGSMVSINVNPRPQMKMTTKMQAGTIVQHHSNAREACVSGGGDLPRPPPIFDREKYQHERHEQADAPAHDHQKNKQLVHRMSVEEACAGNRATLGMGLCVLFELVGTDGCRDRSRRRRLSHAALAAKLRDYKRANRY